MVFLIPISTSDGVHLWNIPLNYGFRAAANPEAMFTIFAITGTAAFIYYTSPMHLTRVLVGAFVETEKTYLERLETGLLSESDVRTIRTRLQLKVSKVREETLSNSRSNWQDFSKFFKGRSFTILRCMGWHHCGACDDCFGTWCCCLENQYS
ncbi:hypothetical protein B0H19DRAFT_1061261 [Mycena capillaripes]|nr:hypothetical protein B0H19DRAFT_1061261 [Mycena capillaripes]